MKLFFSAFLILIFLFLVACSRDNPDTEPEQEVTNQLPAKQTVKEKTASDSIPSADIIIPEDEALPMEQRGGDFTLYGKDGAVSLSDFKGKVVAIYFGYTQCPDICPTSLALLGTALKQLTEVELVNVQGIFISVDPGRDSPEHLADYTKYFHPKIIGISAAPDDLDPVVAQYGAYYEKTSFSNSALLYGVAHTSETYVVGKDGKLTAILPHAAPAHDILQAIRSAL